MRGEPVHTLVHLRLHHLLDSHRQLLAVAHELGAGALQSATGDSAAAVRVCLLRYLDRGDLLPRVQRADSVALLGVVHWRSWGHVLRCIFAGSEGRHALVEIDSGGGWGGVGGSEF